MSTYDVNELHKNDGYKDAGNEPSEIFDVWVDPVYAKDFMRWIKIIDSHPDSSIAGRVSK